MEVEIPADPANDDSEAKVDFIVTKLFVHEVLSHAHAKSAKVL